MLINAIAWFTLGIIVGFVGPIVIFVWAAHRNPDAFVDIVVDETIDFVSGKPNREQYLKQMCAAVLQRFGGDAE